MRVLVSGGSGFVGRAIVARARAAGHEVIAPRHVELDLLTGAGADETLRRLRADGPIDVFVHAAAWFGGLGISSAEPATIFHRNLQMALHAFEVARRHGVGKIVPLNGSCVFPGSRHGDLAEAELWEGRLHDSVEAFATSKRAVLAAAAAYHRQHGLRSGHPVLANVYGPGDVFDLYRSHAVGALIRRFEDASGRVEPWGDGTPVRDFLYVEDAAEAVVRILEREHDLEPVNVGTGVGTSIRELAECVARATGFAGEIAWDTSRPGGVARKVLDPSRMRKVLGWSPAWTLEAGIAETVRWYRAERGAGRQP
jgi:GDP-L-fucose synthase